MYFACHCDNLEMRQEFVRMRLRAIIMLVSLFGMKTAYSSAIWREFTSECDLNELSLELIEIVESQNTSLNPNNTANNDNNSINNSEPNINSINSNNNDYGMNKEAPIDIRILAVLGLKLHISVTYNHAFCIIIYD